MVPPLSQKVAILTKLGYGLSQKVRFSLTFEAILRADFFDKMLALSNKNPPLSLFLAFLAGVFSQFFQNIIRKGHVFTGRHLKSP